MKKTISILLLTFIFLISGCGNSNTADNKQLAEPTSSPAAATVSGELKVQFIDVGQADSILIQDGSGVMLIDAGNNADSNLIVNYIRQQGISKIDYLIGTHPHEDHIGGMDAVIDTFDIGTIYMPKITSNTQTFEDVVTAIRNKDMQITTPVPGSSFKLAEADCTIFAPNGSDYDNVNDYSIVVRLDYEDTSFLFTGDAESVSENEMINKGYDIDADVLKVGHHGSDSSTTEAFLKKVSPDYAVISVGQGNTYGHPAAATLNRLKNAGVKIYRTDESGTIIAASNGKNVTFDKIASSGMPAQDNINVSASIDNPNPAQNAIINLTVAGPAGGSVNAVCHYKSIDTPYAGIVGTDGEAIIPIRIGRAAKGFTVEIEIAVSYNGETYNTKTSFTPQ
ncbi:hydroxyacylglutathione hydrolase [Oxobacter pfennigii]|uniref:Hydroxyacylglutathione hydrolase n=1 Tax=Oxobacter pfennigii TaxID=36849 RepID=A0A0P8X4V2_9CLOT|nr:ComEC/Rec2 family competence protein [Oxobacter pfennigii]KPU45801.1 hydroxyacylglutathione hydrolase [Oxobacter pfennigii]